MDTRCLTDKGEGIHIGQALVEMDPPIGILKRAHHMITGNAFGALEPAHLGHVAIARHNAQPAVPVHFMNPMFAALLQPVQIAGRRINRK